MRKVKVTKRESSYTYTLEDGNTYRWAEIENPEDGEIIEVLENVDEEEYHLIVDWEYDTRLNIVSFTLSSLDL